MTPQSRGKIAKTAVFRHRWQAWQVVRSIAAVRQRPRTPRNWRCSFTFFESFLWHFNEKQRGEVIFRHSRPVSCKNQENGAGKQWSVHAPLKQTTQWVGYATTVSRNWCAIIGQMFAWNCSSITYSVCCLFNVLRKAPFELSTIVTILAATCVLLVTWTWSPDSSLVSLLSWVREWISLENTDVSLRIVNHLSLHGVRSETTVWHRPVCCRRRHSSTFITQMQRRSGSNSHSGGSTTRSPLNCRKRTKMLK